MNIFHTGEDSPELSVNGGLFSTFGESSLEAN